MKRAKYQNISSLLDRDKMFSLLCVVLISLLISSSFAASSPALRGVESVEDGEGMKRNLQVPFAPSPPGDPIPPRDRLPPLGTSTGGNVAVATTLQQPTYNGGIPEAYVAPAAAYVPAATTTTAAAATATTTTGGAGIVGAGPAGVSTTTTSTPNTFTHESVGNGMASSIAVSGPGAGGSLPADATTIATAAPFYPTDAATITGAAAIGTGVPPLVAASPLFYPVANGAYYNNLYYPSTIAGAANNLANNYVAANTLGGAAVATSAPLLADPRGLIYYPSATFLRK